jgi:hypothetical protein
MTQEAILVGILGVVLFLGVVALVAQALDGISE